jgi:hypothetical protein
MDEVDLLFDLAEVLHNAVDAVAGKVEDVIHTPRN